MKYYSQYILNKIIAWNLYFEIFERITTNHIISNALNIYSRVNEGKSKNMRDDVSWGSSPLKLKRNGGEGKKKFLFPILSRILIVHTFLCSVWPVCTKIKLRKEFRQPGHQFFFLIFRLNFAHAWTPLSLSLSLFFLFFFFLLYR